MKIIPTYEAIQWPGYYTEEIKTFAGDNLKETEPRDGIGVVGYLILTPNGKTWLHKEDWIVKDVNGHFFHIPKEKFDGNYKII